MLNQKHKIILLIIVAVGIFLRFYNLNWGSPYYFHPDEQNIAYAVSQVRFPKHWVVNCFAYGTFPIYLIYFSGVLGNLIVQKANVWAVDFAQAILIGRYVSAILSCLTIWPAYILAKDCLVVKDSEYTSQKPVLWQILAVLLVTFTPGLLQFSHFMTFETILTFLYLIFFIICLKIIRREQWKHYLIAGLVLGVTLATKVTSLALFPILIASHFWTLGNKLTKNGFGQEKLLKQVFVHWQKLFSALLLAAIIFVALFPYVLLDYNSFKAAIKYDGGLAVGTLPVFYTAGFLKTTPLIFQSFHVFPHLLGLALWAGVFVGNIYLIATLVKSRKNLTLKDKAFCLFPICKGLLQRESTVAMLLFFIFTYWISHGFMYVKWTRYMVPIVPFLIIAFIAASNQLSIVSERLAKIIAIVVVLITVVSGLTFFLRYLRPDPRVTAAEWAEQNIPSDAQILSEVHDLGILPFNNVFGAQQIELFNFYDIDGPFGKCNEQTVSASSIQRKISELAKSLAKIDYIIIPSRRIYATRLRLPECFPNGKRYYEALFNGNLGFSKIYETENLSLANRLFAQSLAYPELVKGFDRSIAQSLGHFFSPEETYNVFDNPTVLIFGKVGNLTAEEYEDLLSQN
ncbi:glycosyltransferase family 39 protein [Patescibacteria group bacterium]|nr:glycosyltransferase family 39 protein [Patescibacteria group bacterium]